MRVEVERVDKPLGAAARDSKNDKVERVIHLAEVFGCAGTHNRKFCSKR
jgi:hypothetical protein